MSEHETIKMGDYRVDTFRTTAGWHFQISLPSGQFDERNNEQITPDRILITEGGFKSRQVALGCASAWLDGLADDEDWDYDNELDVRPTCGCPLCYCSNRTVAGETCNDCLAGTHQG